MAFQTIINRTAVKFFITKNTHTFSFHNSFDNLVHTILALVAEMAINWEQLLWNKEAYSYSDYLYNVMSLGCLFLCVG